MYVNITKLKVFVPLLISNKQRKLIISLVYS